MSEPVVEPVVEPPVKPEVNNPPYYDDLMTLPEDVRPLVEPLFKGWDAKTTQKFQELHSEFEPWKDVIAEYEPDVVNQAIQLADLLDKNPKALYDYMQEYFKFGSEQGQGTPVEPPVEQVLEGEDAIFSDPRFQELQNAVQQMATLLVTNQNETTYKQQQEALDLALSDLKTKHGDFDEDYIINRLAIGDSPDEAVANYQKTIDNALQARGLSAAPVVTPANGGTSPSVVNGGKRLGELTNKETTDIVAKMLADAAASQT